MKYVIGVTGLPVGDCYNLSRDESGESSALITADSKIRESAEPETLRSALAFHDFDPFLHLWLGLSLWERNCFEQAEEELESAQRFGLKEWRTNWYKALIVRDDARRWGSGRYCHARKLVSKVLSARPDFEAAKVYRLYLWGYYSQWGQDVLAEDFFSVNPPSNKVFLDVGAFDGVNLSNSRRFFDCGWRGVCVEPVSENFKLLQEAFGDESVLCVRRAISDQDGWVDITIAGTGASLLFDRESAGLRTERVSTSTLGKLAAELNLPQIDLVSIDVEGFDYQALRGLDFERYRPGLIIVEHNCLPEVADPVLELMSRSGYALWHDNRQDFFLHPREAHPPENFWRSRTLLPARPRYDSLVRFDANGPVSLQADRLIRAIPRIAERKELERVLYLLDVYFQCNCPYELLNRLCREIAAELPQY